jgi:hypothetical protein
MVCPWMLSLSVLCHFTVTYIHGETHP